MPLALGWHVRQGSSGSRYMTTDSHMVESEMGLSVVEKEIAKCRRENVGQRKRKGEMSYFSE